LVDFLFIWYSFPVLVSCTKINLATLAGSRFTLCIQGQTDTRVTRYTYGKNPPKCSSVQIFSDLMHNSFLWCKSRSKSKATCLYNFVAKLSKSKQWLKWQKFAESGHPDSHFRLNNVTITRVRNSTQRYKIPGSGSIVVC
jgi:hypothetical protein